MHEPGGDWAAMAQDPQPQQEDGPQGPSGRSGAGAKGAKQRAIKGGGSGKGSSRKWTEEEQATLTQAISALGNEAAINWAEVRQRKHAVRAAKASGGDPRPPPTPRTHMARAPAGGQGAAGAHRWGG